MAVSLPHESLLPVFHGLFAEILAEPFPGHAIIAFLEVAVCNIERDEISLGLTVKRGSVIQFHKDISGIGILIVPIV